MSIGYVTFLSEAAAIRLTPAPNVALISISNPGEETALLNGWPPLLRVRVAQPPGKETAPEIG